MRGLALPLALVASPVAAQVSNPAVVPAVDTSQFATPAQAASIANSAASAAVAADTTHATTSALSAVQASIPLPCSTVPAKDTLNGSVGTATACTPLADSTRPTAVQAGNTTLAANCSFSITFARAFTSSTPFVYAAVVDSSGNQMPCKIQTRSAQIESGICQPSQTVSLNLTQVTAGASVAPFGTTCTAGTPVMFVGREPTQ